MANSKSKTYRQAKNVASLYLRMSVESDEKGTGLESQEAELRQLAAQHGLRVLEPPHVDDGYSGALRDNPGFLAWLDDARKGGAPRSLLAYHVDRISRAATARCAEVDGRPRRSRPPRQVHLVRQCVCCFLASIPRSRALTC